MEDGGKIVTVHISTAALKERAARDGRKTKNITLLYSAYREEIEAAARAKYNPQCHRDNADVVVVASDIVYPPKTFSQERPGGKR
jgi:Protein of unknown function (DUF1488)